MKKNDKCILSITDFTQEGLGVGHVDGMAVFVKDTVIGDQVEALITSVKKTYAYGRAERILQASPQRVTPLCRVARPCGGCQLQMMAYGAQLRFKEEKVKACLRRIGGFSEALLEEVTEPIIGMEHPFRYRNKAQFPIGKDKSGALVAGFFAGRTHSIIDQRDCAIGVEENQRILDLVLGHMERWRIAPYDEGQGTGLVRHVMTRKGFATGQLMVVIILNGTALPGEEELADALWQIPGMTSFAVNTNTRNTNVIFGENTRTIRGEDFIEDTIGDVRFRISSRSFYQVNPVQTQKLYTAALEFADLTGTETVWDLYCGIGTISLFLARRAQRVFGVEIVPEAIVNAKENAALNGIENVSFFVGKAEEVLPEKYEKEHIRADVIVVDPPRKGCDPSVLETMIRMAPARIVYVSCDPATLARDLGWLGQNGYALKRVQPCDMFPQCTNVEVVTLLERRA